MADITPDGVVGPGLETPFAVTFTEVGDSTIGSALLTLPAGFTKGEDETLTVTSSVDNETDPAWEAVWSDLNSALAIALTARSDDALLKTGDWVSVGFKAITPPEIKGDSEDFTFTTKAWTDRAGKTQTGDDSQNNINNPAKGDYSSGSYDYESEELTVTVSETLHGALSSPTIESGATVYVHPGTYQEDLTITQDNLTLEAVEKDTVVIEGTVTEEAEGVVLLGITVTDGAEIGMLFGTMGGHDGDKVVHIPDSNLGAVISEVLGRPVGAITVDHMKMLTELNADLKGITDLTGLQHATNLSSLILTYNQINDISLLMNLKSLNELDLSVNHVSNINPLSGLTNLVTLHLSHNQIIDITPLIGLKDLDTLSLDNNKISDILPLEGLTQLKELAIAYNQIDDIKPLEGMSNLEGLGLSGNQISDISSLEGLTQLEGLDLSYNQISNITPLSGLTELWLLSLRGNNISNINPLENLTNLWWLNLEKNQINNITPLAQLDNLSNLYLWKNQVSDLAPLIDLPILEVLNVSNNQISNLKPLTKMDRLLELGLNGNQISDITLLASMANLEVLGLSDNQISDIAPLSGLTNLTSLYLSNNNLYDISFISELKSLTDLEIGNNQIRDITPLAALDNLGLLFLANNQISNLAPLSSMDKLYYMNLNGNQISDLAPLSGLTNLAWLELNNNQIVDITPLAELDTLEGLLIGSNQIIDITPLTGLTKIRTLYLDNNQISNINVLNNLTNLWRLDLSYNYLNTNPGSPAMAVIRNLIAAGVNVWYLPQRSWPVQPPFDSPGNGPAFRAPAGPRAGLTPALPGRVSQARASRMASTLLAAAGSGFVTSGTRGDLEAAQRAYQAISQQYQAQGQILSPADRAAVETVLSVTQAAILALQARLDTADGVPVNMAELLEAYNLAMAALAANADHIDAEELADLNALLSEVAAIIEALGP